MAGLEIDLGDDTIRELVRDRVLEGTAHGATVEDRNACTTLSWTCEEPDVWTYSGPSDSIERYLAGEIVTYHEFLTDTSPWCIKPLHPSWHDRILAMLEYTRPHDCPNPLCQQLSKRMHPNGAEVTP
jgi:hypothetical protein